MQAEGAYGRGAKFWAIATNLILAAYATFHIYTGYFRFPNYIQRSVHVAFALVLCYILYGMRRGRRDKPGVPLLDLCLAILSVICTGYIAYNYEYIVMQQVGLSPLELVLGIITILLILSSTVITDSYV